MQYEKDLASDYKELFLKVRDLLLSFDGVEEVRKPKITTYACNGSGVCHLRTMPHGVDIGFLKGFKLTDTYGTLHGTTKRMRVLSIEDYREKEILDYISQAISLNE